MTDDLDDRKSLSIPFLAISDQYANLDLFFGKFVKKWQPARYTTLFLYLFFPKWPPAAILEVRFLPKTIRLCHYVLSMAMLNMKLIGQFMTQLETPQAF